MKPRTLLLAALLMAVGLLSAIVAAAPASAQDSALGIDHDGGAPDINAGPATVAAYGDVTVSLVTEAPPTELGAWTVDIHYDPLVLTPVACTPYGYDGGAVCNLAYSPTEVRVSGADSHGVAGTADLMDVTFRAKGSAGTCTPLGVEAATFADINSVSVVPTVSNGTICITNACADVSGDGYVGGRDVVAIVLAALFRPHDSRYDLNGDGRVNLADIRIAIGQLGTSC